MELENVATHFHLRARASDHYVILHPASTKEGGDFDISLVYVSLFVLSERIVSKEVLELTRLSGRTSDQESLQTMSYQI